MDKLKKLIGVAIIVLGLILLPTTVALSQDMCEGNFDYDKDVDGTDASVFKSDFGRSQLKNPCPGGFAAVEKSGQTTSYASGDDGDLERGVPYPSPRFENLPDIVYDNLTGLGWYSAMDVWGQLSWEACLEKSAPASGIVVPNIRQFQSLLDHRYYNPALSNSMGDGQWTQDDPFYLPETSGFVWTSTTCATGSQYAWAVDLYSGVTEAKSKTEIHHCWFLVDFF